MIKDQLIRGLNDCDIVCELLRDITVKRTLWEVMEVVVREKQPKVESSTVSMEQSVFAVWSAPHTHKPKHPSRRCKVRAWLRDKTIES